MATNQEVLRSVITTTDQGTPGYGLLSPEQFLAFYELAEVQNPWMSLQNLERRQAHTGSVPRIDYGDDVISPATEAVNSGTFVKPTHDNVPYVQKKGRVAFKLSREAISQSADSGYEQKLVNGFTRAWGRSHQKLAWNGDEASADAMLKLNDGWVKEMAANGNPVDGSTINAGVISIDHFQSALEALPEAWQQREGELKWAMTKKKWNQYVRSLSGRATGTGDLAIERGANGFPVILGIEVVPVPTLTESPNLDKVTLTAPMNTTVVMDDTSFSLKQVTDGITVVSEDIVAYIGFFYADYIMLEVEGTAIIENLDN